ncbi:MAG: response regulator transcription factor, partial [Chloroflexi bacterium]|nr:response regulator transcription factor [Chloroflexota bacterium]
IQGTAAGQTHIDPNVAGLLVRQLQGGEPLPDTTLADSLSEREREVLRLVAHGLTNADIATRLHLSEGTVRNYVSAILTKLQVEDRTQAAVFALRYGLAD